MNSAIVGAVVVFWWGLQWLHAPFLSGAPQFAQLYA